MRHSIKLKIFIDICLYKIKQVQKLNFVFEKDFYFRFCINFEIKGLLRYNPF